MIERADRVVDLCEFKFTDGPYDLSRAVGQELIRKRDVYKGETGEKRALKTVLVAANGTIGYHDGAIAQIIGASELFKAYGTRRRGRARVRLPSNGIGVSMLNGFEEIAPHALELQTMHYS